MTTTIQLGIIIRIIKCLEDVPFPMPLHKTPVEINRSDLTKIYHHLRKYKDSQLTAEDLTSYLRDHNMVDSR